MYIKSNNWVPKDKLRYHFKVITRIRSSVIKNNDLLRTSNMWHLSYSIYNYIKIRRISIISNTSSGENRQLLPVYRRPYTYKIFKLFRRDAEAVWYFIYARLANTTTDCRRIWWSAKEEDSGERFNDKRVEESLWKLLNCVDYIRTRRAQPFGFKALRRHTRRFTRNYDQCTYYACSRFRAVGNDVLFLFTCERVVGKTTAGVY